MAWRPAGGGLSAAAHLWVGPGRVPLLLLYQQNLLLLFVDWNTCCTSWVGVKGDRWQDDALPTLLQTSLEKPDEGQIHWLVSVLMPGPSGFLKGQVVWTQRWDDTTRCIFELNAVTVQDCRTDKKKTCKKGFLCSCSRRRHCFPGFYIYIHMYIIKLWKILFVYLLWAVNSYVKIAFNKYSKVRCALGMQQECCNPFLHLVPLSLFVHVPFLQGWEHPCMKTQRMMGGGTEANWAESIYQILECSFNQLWGSPACPFRLRCDWADKNGNHALCTCASPKEMGV